MALLLVVAGAAHAGTPPPSEHRLAPGSAVPAASRLAEAIDRGSADLVFVFVPARGFADAGDAAALPTGVTAELLRDFAAYVARQHRLQVTVHWQRQADWSQFYADVRDARGGVFGIGNVTITEPRRGELGFSPPYMNNVAVLVTHARQPELASVDALPAQFAPLTALVFTGTLHETRLRRLAPQHFAAGATRAVGSNDALIEQLAGDGDYFAYIDVYNYHAARARDLPLRRHPVADDGSERFGVIMPRDSDWMPVMQAFFAADGGYARSPRFRRHLDTHLGTALAAMVTIGDDDR